MHQEYISSLVNQLIDSTQLPIDIHLDKTVDSMLMEKTMVPTTGRHQVDIDGIIHGAAKDNGGVFTQSDIEGVVRDIDALLGMNDVEVGNMGAIVQDALKRLGYSTTVGKKIMDIANNIVNRGDKQ